MCVSLLACVSVDYVWGGREGEGGICDGAYRAVILLGGVCLRRRLWTNGTALDAFALISPTHLGQKDTEQETQTVA